MTAPRPYTPRTGRATMASMTFNYTGIRVRDLDRSIDFYTRVLGMRLQFRMKIRKTQGQIAVLKSPRGRQRLELNWYVPETRYAKPYRPGEGLDHLAFRTSDLTQKMQELRQMGIPIVEGPIGSRGSAWAYVQDPDGLWIEIFGPLTGR